MPMRRSQKQAKRFSLASPDQLPLTVPSKPSEPIVITLNEHTCPSCEIGAHEHCTGDGCDCCGTED